MERSVMLFSNREDAGRHLGQELLARGYHDGYLVLGLTPGGIRVAYEVAKALNAKLDVCVVRQLGLPLNHEVAMGAVGEGEEAFLDPITFQRYAVSTAEAEQAVSSELKELRRRANQYRSGESAIGVDGLDVIVVDEGVETGSRMKIACRSLKKRGARSIHLALPVGSLETCYDLGAVADSVVCISTPNPFWGVKQAYCDLPEVLDSEVADIIDTYRREGGFSSAS